MKKCEVCGDLCHGLEDGTPRCLKHLPVTAKKIAPPPTPSVVESVQPSPRGGASHRGGKSK